MAERGGAGGSSAEEARAAEAALRGQRVVELGAASRCRASRRPEPAHSVLATDADPEALELVARNAELNGVEVDTAVFDWTSAAATDELAARGPFDLVLAADVLYERPTVARMLSLLPRLAPVVWLADPSRPTGDVFLEQARERGWTVDSAGAG